METLASALIRWSLDNRRSVRESRTEDTGLGIHIADFSKEDLRAGVRIVFTFYRPDSRNWEGADFEFAVI